MFGSHVLETAIAMALLFLVYSVICSSLLEAVNALLGRRGRFLQDELKRLLGESFEKFHKHELIQRLSPAAHPASYFEPETVAKVVLSLDDSTTLDDKTREAIKPILIGSANPADKVEALEKWFEESMDRTSGRFKRWSQLYLLLMGAFVSYFWNLDAISMARAIWGSEAMRAELVNRATSVVGQGKPEEEAIRKALDGIKLPVPCTEPSRSGVPSKSGGCGIPDEANLPGIGITALAISWGADFWFQVLGKLVNLRQAGRRPGVEAM